MTAQQRIEQLSLGLQPEITAQQRHREFLQCPEAMNYSTAEERAALLRPAATDHRTAKDRAALSRPAATDDSREDTQRVPPMP